MVTHTLDYLAEKENFTVHIHQMKFPASEDDIVFLFGMDLLAIHQRVKFALFSHVVSVPGVILPVERMAQQCKEFGIPVIVDGAHALGMIPLNLTDQERYGVDFYIANGHKWLYSPKGTAFLWASDRVQKGLVPTVISSRGLRSYVDGFAYTGTRDYTAFCSIPAAMDYRTSLGDKEIMDYMHTLAVEGGQAVAGIWNTSLLANASMIGSMVDIRVPVLGNESDRAYSAAQRMLEDYGMPVVVYPLKNSEPQTIWMRISAQIYLEIGDFERMARLFLELLQSS